MLWSTARYGQYSELTLRNLKKEFLPKTRTLDLKILKQINPTTNISSSVASQNTTGNCTGRYLKDFKNQNEGRSMWIRNFETLPIVN